MNRPSQYALIAAIGLSLSACAGLGLRGGIQPSAKDSIRTIAVASAMGDTFNGSHVATTVFGNSKYTVDVSDWRVDETLTATAVTTLQRGGKWNAVALPPARDTDLGKALAAARAAGADTLLLAAPARYDNQPDFPPGYGFHRRTFMGIDRPCIFSLFTIKAYKVSSGQALGWEWSFPTSTGIPCSEAADVTWKESFPQYTPQEKESIRRAIETSVRTNVGTSLKGLGLTP